MLVRPVLTAVQFAPGWSAQAVEGASRETGCARKPVGSVSAAASRSEDLKWPKLVEGWRTIARQIEHSLAERTSPDAA